MRRPVSDAHSGERGFTLLEVLVAISLFAIIAAGLATTTIGVIKVNSYSQRATEAMALIEQRLESFRAMDADALGDMLPWDDSDGVASGSDGTMTAAGVTATTGHTRTWEMERVDNNFTLIQVTVTVTWTGPEEYTLSNSAYFCGSSSC